MGMLTDDVTRLCGEISSMRRARVAMKKGLACSTQDRRAAVSQMQAGFANAHGEMARQSKASRSAFVSNLKRAVAGKRREFRDDLAGARRAWLGSLPAQRKGMEFEKRRGAEGETGTPQKEQVTAQPTTRSKHQGKWPKPNRA